MVKPGTGNDNSGMARTLKAQLGQRIKELRKRRGLTQEQLAEAADRSVKAISNIEGGRGGAPIETLYILSEQLGVELKDLFEGVTLRRRGDAARAQLETRLIDTARNLDKDRLAIAIRQLEALLPGQRE